MEKYAETVKARGKKPSQTGPKKIVAIAAVLASAILITASNSALAQTPVPRPEISNAENETVQFFQKVFVEKSAKSVDGTMRSFSNDLLTYGDATVGINISSFSLLEEAFAKYMPNWGVGQSYPTRIIGGPDSAVVFFTDTPELWGADLRIAGSVDLRDGKIIRWVDYFDSTTFSAPDFEKFKTPQAKFPASFKESEISDNATVKITNVATEFQKALASSDEEMLAALMTYDVIYEDMALHTEVLGLNSVKAYLSRILETSPFGKGARLRHIVGGDKGGGFEWTGGGEMENVIGITALELDPDGKVSRITTAYDGRQLGLDRARRLVALALVP